MALIGGRSEQNIQELLLDASKYKKELSDVAKKIRQQQKHEKDLSTVRKALEKQTNELSSKNQKLGQSLPTKGVNGFNGAMNMSVKSMATFAIKAGALIGGLTLLKNGIGALIKNGLNWNDWVGKNADGLDRLSIAVDGIISKMDLQRTRMQLMADDFAITTDQMESLSKASIVLARRLGGDATQSLQKITTALVSGAPNKIMRQLGFDIELTGKKTEKFQSAMELLTERFGDFDAKISNVNEQIKATQSQFEDVTAELGSKLVVAFTPFLKAISSALTGLQNISDWIFKYNPSLASVDKSLQFKINQQADELLAGTTADRMVKGGGRWQPSAMGQSKVFGGPGEFGTPTIDALLAAKQNSSKLGKKYAAKITGPTESFGFGNVDELEAYIEKLKGIESKLSKPIDVGTSVAGDEWADAQRERIDAYFAEADAIDRVIESQQRMSDSILSLLPNAENLTGTFLNVTDSAIQAAFAGQNVFQVIMNAILGLVKQSAFAVASKAAGEAIYASSMSGLMYAEAAGLWASTLNPFGGQAFIPAAAAKTAAAASMSAAATQMATIAAVAGGVGIAASVGQGAMNAGFSGGGSGGGRGGSSPSSSYSGGESDTGEGVTYVNNVYSEGPYRRAAPLGNIMQMSANQPKRNHDAKMFTPTELLDSKPTVVQIDKVVLEIANADPARELIKDRKITAKEIKAAKNWKLL